MGPGLRRGDDAVRCTACPKHGFSHHDNFSPETPPKPSRNLANDGAVPLTPDGPLFPSRRMPRRNTQSSGDYPMSKRIALLSAAAFAALALTATVTAPVSAQEKTVMVGGAAMFPSKNIIQNAVNSKDHTTLVAAV